MKNSIRKGMLVAVIVLAALAYGSLVATAEPCNPTARQCEYNVTVEPAVQEAFDQGNCTSAGVPRTGAPVCISTGRYVSTLTGDFKGTILYEVTVAVFADLSFRATDTETWTGSLAGGRKGTFTGYEYADFGAPNGEETSTSSIFEGTGTGDLTGITGHVVYVGTLGGTYQATLWVKFQK
jgi:hypothetical protein